MPRNLREPPQNILKVPQNFLKAPQLPGDMPKTLPKPYTFCIKNAVPPARWYGILFYGFRPTHKTGNAVGPFARQVHTVGHYPVVLPSGYHSLRPAMPSQHYSKTFPNSSVCFNGRPCFFSHAPYAVPFSESKSSPSPTEWTWRTFVFRKMRGERGGRLGLHAPHPPAHPFPLPGEGLTSAIPSLPRCRGGPCRRCRFRASSRAVRVRRSTRFRRHSRQ